MAHLNRRAVQRQRPNVAAWREQMSCYFCHVKSLWIELARRQTFHHKETQSNLFQVAFKFKTHTAKIQNVVLRKKRLERTKTNKHKEETPHLSAICTIHLYKCAAAAVHSHLRGTHVGLKCNPKLHVTLLRSTTD
eukprot:4808107-Amphidinium_carterae.1